VAETTKGLGLAVSYCPWLRILDNEHASTGIIRSRKVAGYMKDATNYLQRRVKPNASEAALAGLISGCV
jgi:hypothetical protein